MTCSNTPGRRILSDLRLAALPALSALDVHGIYKLRVDVFVHEQATPFAEIDDTDADPATLHMVAADGDQVIGTARLHPSLVDGHRVIQFGRFVVAPHARGTGLGRKIITAILQRAGKDFPGQDIYLTAQLPLIPYYEAFGFTPVGDIIDDTGMPHQPMLRRA